MEILKALAPYISMALSLGGLIAMILASTVKTKSMKVILALVFAGNFLVATSYLIDGNNNGAACCYIGAAQALINYFFDKNNKSIPKWLVAIYAAVIVGINLAVLTEILDLLAIIASLTFILCIGQSNGSKYRFWTIVNMVLWITYDIIKGSYAALFTHVSLFLFTVLGKLIHDRKRAKEDM